jgi:hypothetical protein
MGDVTTEFFDRLSAEPQQLLSQVTTTIRIDVESGKSVETWLLEIDRGRVTAARRKAKADAVLHLDRGLLERIIGGRANAMAAVLRGLITVEGSTAHLVTFQRIFPGPPRKPPPAPIPASEVRGPTSAVAQKPSKAAPKRAVAASKTASKRTTATVGAKKTAAKATSTARPTKATKATKSRAKRSPS